MSEQVLISDISRALFASLGLPVASRLSIAPSPGIEILFLIDGLGAQSLERYRDAAPHITAMTPMGAARSEFPSTTATSLTSIGTGLHPAEHGMLGYTVRIPYSDNRLLNALKWDSRVDPVIWQSRETLFEQGARMGIRSFNISAERYAGTGFTEAALRGATFLGANTFDRMLEQLRVATAHRPAFIYLYINDVDAAGHEFGVGSPEWLDALTMADDFVALLRTNLPAGVRLTLTSDHGMLNAQEQIMIDGELARDLTLIGGEPRARHIYIEAGREQHVHETWQRRLGERADLFLKHEAIAQNLFGSDPTTQTVDRMGDLIVIPRDELVLIEPARKHMEGAMIGHHGGLTDIERAIPLFSFQT